MDAAAEKEQLKAEAAAADEYEVVGEDSEPEPDAVPDVIDGPGDDAALAEAATEGQVAGAEVEITIDENSVDPLSIDETAPQTDPGDARLPDLDGLAVTETLYDVDSSEICGAMTEQTLAQSSAESEVDLSAAEDQNAEPLGPLPVIVDLEEEKGPSDSMETVRQAPSKEEPAKTALPVETSPLDSQAETIQPKTSRIGGEPPSEPASPLSDRAARSDAKSERVSDDDEVLVLVDLIPEIVTDSGAVQADDGKDQDGNFTAEPAVGPPKKVKHLRPQIPPRAIGNSAEPEDESSPDWRSKVKHAMAAKRDLKDIIRAYEGKSIAINYYDSTQVQEAELICVNNLFFSAFVKNQNLLYSFPLHTIISVAEKIDSESDGKSAPHVRFPAVITISPPSYL